MANTLPLLVQALNRQKVVRPPVWFMRQAGRYLPEYRAVRAKFPDFIQFCLTPEAATEVTLQPVTRFGVDAAIIFADILTIPHALGHTVTFTEGHGPNVQPITKPQQVAAMAARLAEIPTKLTPVAQTVEQTRTALPPEKAVIGFCGAPFTLATYLLDTKPSQGIPNTLKFAEEHPTAFTTLLDILTAASATYLSMQIKAGANAIQIFDSWAGACPPALWKQAVHTPLLTLRKALAQNHAATPVILFPRLASQAQLATLAQTLDGTPTALSLSTEVDLAWAAQTLQPRVAIQGNLNPELFTVQDLAPLRAAVRQSLAIAGTQPGYVMNLGHGLTPQTRVEAIQTVMDELQTFHAP
jgi:uroporphyrinogen decarboxylase